MTREEWLIVNKHLKAAADEAYAAYVELRGLMAVHADNCAHENTHYWADPSGNNGGGNVCNDCGKDV